MLGIAVGEARQINRAGAGVSMRDDHPRTPARVERFTSSERAFHWLVAGAFFVWLLGGLLMGKHGSAHNVLYTVHLASGGALVVGLALIVVRGNRRALSQT